MKNKWNKKDMLVYSSLFLLGLAFRLVYLICYPVQPRDSYDYRAVILNWENSGFMPDNKRIHQMSLYLLKVPFHFFKYDLIKGGVIVNTLLGLMLILVIMQISDIVFKNKILSVFSGVIVATHPMFVKYSCSFLTENTFLFFYICSILFFVKYFRMERLADLLLASLFCSVSYYCRLEGVELIIIFLIGFFFQTLFRRIGIPRAILHLSSFFLSLAFFSYALCYLFSFKPIQIYDFVARLSPL